MKTKRLVQYLILIGIASVFLITHATGKDNQSSVIKSFKCICQGLAGQSVPLWLKVKLPVPSPVL